MFEIDTVTQQKPSTLAGFRFGQAVDNRSDPDSQIEHLSVCSDIIMLL